MFKPSTPPAKRVSRDLTDAEFAELDDLLLATPEPLEPVDVVMLDGYLCGVLVQPLLLESATWLPHVFDFDGQPLPDDVVKALRAATDRILAEAVAKDPITKKVHDSYMTYKAKYDAWADLSETVYHTKIRRA